MATEREHSHRSLALPVLFAALGGLLFGYDTGVISGAILFISRDFGLRLATEEFVVSAVLAGATLGGALGGLLADAVGRRKTLIGAAALFVLGAVLAAVAPDVGILVVARLIVGLAIGCASLVAPLYIAEIAPARLRGSLVAINQLALTGGILVAYLVDYALAPAGLWRWMLGLAVVPGLVLGLGMVWLPDSPRWLQNRGQKSAALSALRRLGAASEELQLAVGAKAAPTPAAGHSLLRLWRPQLRRVLLLGVVLAVAQQITGINTVIYYAPTILRMAGIGSDTAAILATLGLGAVNFFFTFVAVYLLDRVGRRPLLLGGVAVMAAALALLGWAFWAQIDGAMTAIAGAALALYIAAFAIGLGPVFWLLLAEIYPLSVRGSAMAIATTANWGSNLLVAITFLSLTAALGTAWTFWLYAALAVMTLLFCARYVPETKGKSLESIEAQIAKGHHPRHLRAEE